MTQLSPNTIQADLSCSQLSLQVGEQMLATATTVKTWLLLEYPFPWGHDAFLESDLSTEVKDYISTILTSLPQARLQMIKSQNSRQSNDIALFVGTSQALQPKIYEFHLNAYEDLMSMDIPAIVSGHKTYQSALRSDPLYLVCTNGKRDQCCAKFGFLTYTIMSKNAKDFVWQSTHMGGHRFAPNVLCFPHGICYGRVTGREVRSVVKSYRKGEIYIENYRGRTCYEKYIQAAEYFLYQQGGTRDLDAYQLLDVREISKDEWQVEFKEKTESTIHRVHLLKELTSFSIRESCSSTDQKISSQYKLIQYQSFS